MLKENRTPSCCKITRLVLYVIEKEKKNGGRIDFQCTCFGMQQSRLLSDNWIQRGIGSQRFCRNHKSHSEIAVTPLLRFLILSKFFCMERIKCYIEVIPNATAQSFSPVQIQTPYILYLDVVLKFQVMLPVHSLNFPVHIFPCMYMICYSFFFFDFQVYSPAP